MEITSKTALELWKKALRYVFETGKDFTDKDYRNCREIQNLMLRLDDIKTVTKPIETINSFKKWIYPPLEELESFVLGKKEIPGYYYNYGARAFNFGTINQIDNFIIPILKKDKTSRRAILQFYNPEIDSHLSRKDTPSMIMINFNIRNEKLNATAIIRSNDLFFGWPANVYQISVVMNYIAKALGIETGSLTTLSISAHIFEDQFEYIKRLIE